jgi:hypothetical protein
LGSKGPQAAGSMSKLMCGTLLDLLFISSFMLSLSRVLRDLDALSHSEKLRTAEYGNGSQLRGILISDVSALLPFSSQETRISSFNFYAISLRIICRQAHTSIRDSLSRAGL